VPACVSCKTELPEGANFCFRCGTKQPPPDESRDPLIGKTIGAFRIIAPLGEGAMGKVYRAEQTSLGRLVCIKTLQSHLAKDPKLIQRFEREARAASALKHPNIVSVLDVGRTNEGLLYIVMELVEGRSLKALITSDAPLPIDRAFAVHEQILSALEEAHQAGIVHRDLKPDNVLIAKLRDGSDLAKVVDFGLAKLQDEGDVRLTATGAVFGTPGYMAPEQIVGEEVDGRADLYAAGIILYELLTSRKPFSGKTMKEVLSQHLTEMPASPSRLGKLPIPPSVDEIVLRALEKDAKRRFKTALEFKRALEAVRFDLRSPAGPATRAPETAAPPRSATPSPIDRTATARGVELLPLASRAAPGTRFESLQSGVVPDKLLEHMADLESMIAGERRNVTVLFGDISGFTAMSEAMSPEEVRAIMNRCFDGMVEAVHSYDGTVDKFIGDCIMVLFGAPRAHEDDPERAVRCAIEMIDHLAKVNRTLKRPLGMRIGINSGEVVAGGVGGAKRMDYTVMGDVVNTAKRIESAAEVNTILVSRSVQRLTEKIVAYQERHPISVKGKSQPIQTYQVLRLADRASDRVEVIVGRAKEHAAIERVVLEAASGRGSGLLVIGEPGIGKTTSLRKAERAARLRGLVVARGSAGRLGAATGLEVVRQTMLSLSGPRPDQASSLVGLGLDRGDLERLEHFFGTKTRTAPFELDDRRILDRGAILRAYTAAAKKTGLCLILDDLHAADRDSLEILDELARRAPSLRLAILASARPGETDRILPACSRMELRPMPPLEIAEIARLELGAKAAPPEVTELVCSRSDGNPHFAKEILRTLIDAGSIELKGGTWHVGALDASVVPDRVQLLVASRVDAISQPSKRFLRAAAVAGNVFTVELVSAALEEPGAVQEALSECQNRGLIAPGDQPLVYQFSQSLVREAVLAGLTKPDRRHLHLRLADAIERGIAPSDDHPAEALARHLLAAEQYRKAVEYLSLAGERLAERNAFSQAADHYKSALEISMKEIAKRGATSEEAANQVLSLASKAVECSSLIAADRALEIAEPVLSGVPESRAAASRAELLRQRARCYLRLSKIPEAESDLDRALIFAVKGDGSPEALADLRADRAAAFEARGALGDAAKELTEGFGPIVARISPQSPRLWTYMNQLGRIHLRLGQLDRARGFFENARSQAKRAGNMVGEGRALTNLAVVVARSGDLVLAGRLFEEALEITDKSGDKIGVARAHVNLGRVLLLGGKKAEGKARLEQALALARDLGWTEGIASAQQAIDASS
jgi:eukaryotic-like serine/threonine-protein kinase